MIRQMFPVLATVVKIVKVVAPLAALLGSLIAWYVGPAMLKDWAWVHAEYILAVSLVANLMGLVWWAWQKTPRLVITNLDKQTLSDGRVHRINIEVKNISIMPDKFSVHVRIEKDGKPYYFGITDRYSVKTHNREADYAHHGREEDHLFNLSGGQSKTLCIFSLDSPLTQFVFPIYIITNPQPFDEWKILVSVDASNYSREYEVVHIRTENGLKLYLQTKLMDGISLDIEAKEPLPQPPPQKRRQRSRGI